jgi:uncharacterized membrane protein YjfL (UPF0719 family)
MGLGDRLGREAQVKGGTRMARVWIDYLIAIGWGVVGAISMACGLAILLKVFDWLTPIDEWEEVRKGNTSVAIILAAVILALGIAIGFAIMPVPAAR